MRATAVRTRCVLVAILALAPLPTVGTAKAQSPTPTQPAACLDFASQEEAQEFFESEGGPDQDPSAWGRIGVPIALALAA